MSAPIDKLSSASEVLLAPPINDLGVVSPDFAEAKIQFHALAEIFPLFADADERALERDIKEKGLLHPIIIYESQILDGRRRYSLCKALGVPPKFITYDGSDPVGLVISLNVRRRHLTNTQRALAAARLATLAVGSNQHTEGLSIERASQLLGVTVAAVGRARQLLLNRSTELIAAVESGAVALSAAADECSRSLRQQRRQTGCVVSLPLDPSDTASEPSPGFPAIESVIPNLSVTETAEEPSPEPSDSAHEVAIPDDSNVPPCPSAVDHRSEMPGVSSPSPISPGPAVWLWPTFIPSSAVTAVVGNAYARLVAISLAATVSAGGEWPDYDRASNGRVLWLTDQYRGAYVLRPLLQAAGADITFVPVLEPEQDDYGLPIRNLEADLFRVRSALGDRAAPLVVIDFFAAYLACIDADAKIPCLQPAAEALQAIAVKYRTAIVLSCPLPFKTGAAALDRARNAITTAPAIESVLVVERDGSGKRGVMRQTKGVGLINTQEFSFAVMSRMTGYSTSGKADAVVWVTTEQQARGIGGAE